MKTPTARPLLPHGMLALALSFFLTASAVFAAEEGTRFEDVSGVLDGFVFDGGNLSGVAWLDADGDGNLDLYVLSGAGGNGLFLGDGEGGFVNTAADAGVLTGPNPDVAVAAGDLDNDGDTDLVVLGDAVGPFSIANTLFANNGDGTFTDVTTGDIPAFPTSASTALVDYDGDGLLDVAVTGPGTVGIPESFGLVDDDGNPIVWDARMDATRLFRNLGGLRFEDVTEAAGLGLRTGGCAVSAGDIDQDGDQDIVVASCNLITEGPVGGNCFPGIPCRYCEGEDDPGPCRPMGSGGQPIQAPLDLWMNDGPDAEGNVTFTNAGLDPTSGLGAQGGYWMSVNLGDVNGDGWIDIFSTNVGPSVLPDVPPGPHGLWLNNGDGTFTEVAAEAGVADWDFGWGASLHDFDNDGDLDLFYSGAAPPFGGPGHYFTNDGDGNFTDAPEILNIDLTLPVTSGCAAGDFDNDGFLDLAITNSNAALADDGMPLTPLHPIVLRNQGNGNNHLEIQAIGTVSNRSGVGARFMIHTESGAVLTREVYAGSSYLSTEMPYVHAGLGDDEKARFVDVVWPSGYKNRLYNVRGGQRTKFPELPCSFDDPEASFAAYLGCAVDALDLLVERGDIHRARAARILVSAIRAWNSAH